MPKVSIITPCYNAAGFIGRTIESVRRQTLTDWEQIVVDDGSTDGSADIVRGYCATEGRVRLIQQTNGGVCKARNTGYKHCAADSNYLLFFDADDLMHPEMLAVMVAYLDARPDVGMTFCGFQWIDPQDRLLLTPTLPRYGPTRFGAYTLPQTEARTPFASIYCIAPTMESCSLLRRAIYERTPGWDENFGQFHEGPNLFLHFALLSEVHFIPEPLYLYRQHGTQFTAGNEVADRQIKKLAETWRHMPGLTPEQRQIVRHAEWFRQGRLIPHTGMKQGYKHLKSGEIGLATRFFMGAARRYIASFLPGKKPGSGSLPKRFRPAGA